MQGESGQVVHWGANSAIRTRSPGPADGRVLPKKGLSSYGLADAVVFDESGPMRCFWSSNLSQIDTRSSLLVILVV